MPSATAFLTSVRTILNERAEAIERDASEAERLLRRYQGAVIEYRADLDALILRARLAGQLTAFTEDIAAIEERLATQAAEVAQKKRNTHAGKYTGSGADPTRARAHAAAARVRVRARGVRRASPRRAR